jgi:hypothetical protein
MKKDNIRIEFTQLIWTGVASHIPFPTFWGRRDVWYTGITESGRPAHEAGHANLLILAWPSLQPRVHRCH